MFLLKTRTETAENPKQVYNLICLTPAILRQVSTLHRKPSGLSQMLVILGRAAHGKSHVTAGMGCLPPTGLPCHLLCSGRGWSKNQIWGIAFDL